MNVSSLKLVIACPKAYCSRYAFVIVFPVYVLVVMGSHPHGLAGSPVAHAWPLPKADRPGEFPGGWPGS